MKAITTILFLFYSINCMGQSRHLMDQISSDLNRELEGVALRNSSYRFYFEKKEANAIQNIREDLHYPHLVYSSVTKILNKYVDSLVTSQRYELSVYYDLYSPKVYAYIDTIKQEWYHHDLYPTKPKIGTFPFLEKVYAELRIHQDELDTLTWSDWWQPIYLFIDSRTPHKIIKANKLVKYLDSSLNIPWIGPMYHAEPINVVVEIRLDQSLLHTGMRSTGMYRHEPIEESYVLSKQYSNKWVRFTQRQPDFSGDIMVSFIFNPINSKVENAVIVKGDFEEATQLIEWIEKLNLTEDMLYWPSYPFATRIYFFIDAN